MNTFFLFTIGISTHYTTIIYVDYVFSSLSLFFFFSVSLSFSFPFLSSSSSLIDSIFILSCISFIISLLCNLLFIDLYVHSSQPKAAAASPEPARIKNI